MNFILSISNKLKKLWPTRIRSQLIWGIALVHLVLMSVFIFDMVNRQKRFLKKQNKEQAVGLANDFAVNSASYITANDFDGLERLVKSHQNFPNLKYAMIISTDGIVQAHTVAKYVGSKLTDSISLSLKPVKSEQVLVDDDNILDLAVPVRHNNEMVGWARIGLGKEYINKSLADITRDGILYTILALIIGSIFAILIANKLSQGLYKLVIASRKIGSGDRNARVSPSRSLEISQLGTAFNKMLDEISSNEKLMGMVLENMPVGVWMLNEKGEILSANSAGKKIWGGIEYVGMNEYGIYKGWHLDTGKLIEPHEWGAARAISNGETSLNEEIEIECFDKSHKVILHSSLPLFDAQNKIIGAIVINVDITERKNAESELRLRNAEIRERMKELSCLYKLSELASKPDKSMEETLMECVHLLPPAYQYPEVTCARIIFDEKEFTSADFRETAWKQKADIYLNDILAGTVEVYYTHKMPEEQEGPFLMQERFLINSIAGLLGSAAERKRGEQEILRLNRLNLFISHINESMLKSETRETIFSEACRVAIEFGKFQMAWIGRYDENSRNVIPHVSAGYDHGYLDKINISAESKPAGKGPTGRAIRDKNFYYCNDIANDPEMLPWREEALKRNYRSSISLAIVVDEKVDAVFSLYAAEPFFFNDAEIALLLDVRDNISFALDKIRIKELQAKAEDALKESEVKFRSLVEQSLVGVYILQDGRFVYVNPGFEKTIGYSKEQLINELFFEQLIHEEDLNRVRRSYTLRVSGQKTDDHYAFRAIRSDGQILHIEAIVSVINYNGKPAVIGTLIDITDRVEEEKRMGKAVTDAQENERIQIGMELHDNVKQILAASHLQLDIAKSKLDDKEVVAEIINTTKNYVAEAIHELRRLSHQLAPSVGASDPFEAKVYSLLETMNVTDKLKAIVDVDGIDEFVSSDIQLAFYRILQEQVSNILKYAEASTVEIAIRRLGRNILMQIKDDGKGFDITIKKNGIGLENIKRRVNLLNGKAEINSSPGEGCEVFVQIPVVR